MLNIQSHAARSAAALLMLGAANAPAVAADVQSRLRELWRGEITKAPIPEEGCFTAEYPSKTWQRVACVKVAAKPFIRLLPAALAGSRTVGNGNDYAAIGSGTVTSAKGYFPYVKGLTSETDGGKANIYSLQLNSNFFKTSACNGATNPAQCQGWEQFLYSSGEQSTFIQYWLINYGNTCPTKPYNDWNQFKGSCYRNSVGMATPAEPITDLPSLELRGYANGTHDSVVLFDGDKVYRAGGKDDVVVLAKGWAASEFNVFGDAGGSSGDFNKGTFMSVRVVQRDGTEKAPTCKGNSGTTGETTNLTLGPCRTGAGFDSFILFTQHN